MDQLWEDQLVCTSDNIFTRGQSDINLLHINICNLRHKVADINCDELYRKADRLLMNETHLSKGDDLCNLAIGQDKSLAVFRNDRDGAGGGVALFMNVALNPTHLHIDQPIEAVAVKVENPIQMVFISVYRPPHNTYEIFC